MSTLIEKEFEELTTTLPKELSLIGEKIFSGSRLDHRDGLTLFAQENPKPVWQLANLVRKLKAGDTVYFSSTLYIHPTNLCELSCALCSFYAKPGWKTAWFMTPEDIEKKVRENLHEDLTEVHIVGGLWRECDLPYYEKVFKLIKSINPNLHIKALTPVEYHFLAKLHNISVEEVFEKMISWGLGSLPGGGAEILVEEIRKKIAAQKITSEEYLNVHRIAHKMGLHSNVTMLFGHIEEPHHILQHLDSVRTLQDETGGFQTFVPLKFHTDNNALGKRKDRLKPKDIRTIYAISRLMLDNVRNLKVLWNYLGIDEAKTILHCGGNDLAATQLEEKIITMAGGIKVKMTSEILSQIIRDEGRIPKKIHSGHKYELDEI